MMGRNEGKGFRPWHHRDHISFGNPPANRGCPLPVGAAPKAVAFPYCVISSRSPAKSLARLKVPHSAKYCERARTAWASYWATYQRSNVAEPDRRNARFTMAFASRSSKADLSRCAKRTHICRMTLSKGASTCLHCVVSSLFLRGQRVSFVLVRANAPCFEPPPSTFRTL
ncbi:hypothetical protein FHX05_006004 [Rhizobium sp. BK491]|nr:hypothetical protein [Rhizobium sp. BK491]